MSASLSTLASEFSLRPMVVSRAIRDLMDHDRERFLKEVAGLLSNDTDSPAAHFLITLLTGNQYLVDALCDPALFSAPEAIRVAASAHAHDPYLDVKLAREIVSRAHGNSGAALETVSRGLEIIGSISDGVRVIAVLARLLQHANPKLRSKATLLVGRINRNLEWAARRMAETDVRVRANTIESLWGLDTPEAREAFSVATRDSDNRVAGNGAVGLYQSGDLAAIDALLDMAGREEAPFRATAAWAMGETLDPRFLPALSKLIATPDTRIRQNAFRAMSRIRQRLVALKHKSGVIAEVLQADLEDSTRVVRVSVGLNRDNSPPRPLDFIVIENNEIVRHSSVDFRGRGDSVSVGFALPAISCCEQPLWLGCVNAIRSNLWKKHASDIWGAVRYQRDSAQCDSLDEPLLSSETVRLLEEATRPVARARSARSFAAAIQRLAAKLAETRGKRVLFIMGDRGDLDPTELLDTASGACIEINAFMTAPVGPGLVSLCRETGGYARQVPHANEFTQFVRQRLARLADYYEIRYLRSPNPLRELKVQVYSDQGYGEGSWLP